MLPDTMAASDDDREDGTPEASREAEGSRLKRYLDPKDGALWEEDDAISGLDGGAGAPKEGPGSRGSVAPAG